MSQTDQERLKQIVPWYGEETPAGWVEINDSNAIFRGDIDAANGIFAGTVEANRLDVLTKLNVREGAVSSYITTTRLNKKEVRITIPAHFGEHASFVDFCVPVWVHYPAVSVFVTATNAELSDSRVLAIMEKELAFWYNPTKAYVYRQGSLIEQYSFKSLVPFFHISRARRSEYVYKYVQSVSNYNVSLRFFDFEPITEDTTYRFILANDDLHSGRVIRSTQPIHYTTAGIRVR